MRVFESLGLVTQSDFRGQEFALDKIDRKILRTDTIHSSFQSVEGPRVVRVHLERELHPPPRSTDRVLAKVVERLPDVCHGDSLSEHYPSGAPMLLLQRTTVRKRRQRDVEAV